MPNGMRAATRLRLRIETFLLSGSPFLKDSMVVVIPTRSAGSDVFSTVETGTFAKSPSPPLFRRRLGLR